MGSRIGTLDERLILTLDVGGTKIAGGILSVGTHKPPRLECSVCTPTCAEEGGTAVLQRIVGFACELLGRENREVCGIGVGAAGIISKGGSVASATELMPGWSGMPLAPALRTTTGRPVAVMGDVHAHALGEAHWGAGKGHRSMLMVAVGTGIGGAMVIDGRVLHGEHNAGGHFGHVMHPAATETRCSCGRYGHVEPIASGLGIEARYRRISGTSLGGDRIAQLAREGDSVARETIEFAGRALGQALGMQANVLDPEIIVLSGSVCGAGRLWLDALREGYRDQALGILADVPIELGVLGGKAPLMGAAVPVLAQLDGTVASADDVLCA